MTIYIIDHRTKENRYEAVTLDDIIERTDDAYLTHAETVDGGGYRVAVVTLRSGLEMRYYAAVELKSEWPIDDTRRDAIRPAAIVTHDGKQYVSYDEFTRYMDYADDNNTLYLSYITR